jgi:hypothetical protein
MWISRLRALVTRLVSPRRVERDLDEELRAYVDLRTEELVATGLSRDDAARRARLALGGAEAVKESVRLVRTGTLIEQTWRDVRYACRGLLRAPGFTLIVVLTIGLGLGVNTAMFSVIDATLFRPLPYERPDDLVMLGRERAGMTVRARMSWDDVARWRSRTDLFQGVEVSGGGRAWHWLERDEEVVVAAFTPGLPALLGIGPAMGRVVTPEETDRKAPVIVIADGLWTRAFGRRPDVLGTTMTINGRSMTIVGVMPPAFRFGPGGGGDLEAWIGMPERSDPDVPLSDRVWPTFRIRPGLTRDAAQALVVEAAALMQQDLPTNARWEPRLTSFVEARRTGARSDMRPAMLMLLATAGLVLLVACVNVANLLLARGAGRSQELAMRAALGATRARVARLLLAEGVILAALGGVVALLLATWTTALVVVLIPPEMHTRMFMVGLPELDGRVLTFAAMETTCAALLGASWPAFAGSRIGRRHPGHRLAGEASGARASASEPVAENPSGRRGDGAGYHRGTLRHELCGHARGRPRLRSGRPHGAPVRAAGGSIADTRGGALRGAGAAGADPRDARRATGRNRRFARLCHAGRHAAAGLRRTHCGAGNSHRRRWLFGDGRPPSDCRPRLRSGGSPRYAARRHHRGGRRAPAVRSGVAAGQTIHVSPGDTRNHHRRRRRDRRGPRLRDAE